MNYFVTVRNLFNDMMAFFSGKEAIGLEALQDAYQDEPLFLAFISDLPEALKVPYRTVMKECYNFYKQYYDRELSDSDWENIVAGIQAYDKKWDNVWCRNLILALLGILECEDKERKGLTGEHSSGADDLAQDPESGEGEEPETDEDGQRMEAAA